MGPTTRQPIRSGKVPNGGTKVRGTRRLVPRVSCTVFVKKSFFDFSLKRIDTWTNGIWIETSLAFRGYYN